MSLLVSYEFVLLEQRMTTLLPPQYREVVEEVRPTSMGTAGLKFDSDGRVMWDKMWGSFCDLAMAGGPPHRGVALEPGSVEQILDQPARYEEVVSEICRGISLVTSLSARPSPWSGWIEVECHSVAMAGWLVRAITMENVSISLENASILLPAGSEYRLEKEVKNVITVTAKTCHYWLEHMSAADRLQVDATIRQSELLFPLVQPQRNGSAPEFAAFAGKIARAIEMSTGMVASVPDGLGWVALQAGAVRVAIWMMRALAVLNVLARREGSTLLVALDSSTDPEGQVAERITEAYHYSIYKKVMLASV